MTTTTTPTARGGLRPFERVARIVGGGLVVILGINVALASDGFAIWAWFGVALFGLDFVVTGIRGYCPLYARLGIGR